MSATSEFLLREDVEKMLAPYGGHFLEISSPGVEVWGTPWGTEFSLALEWDGQRYDEWAVLEAINIIRPTIPPDWLLAELES